MPHTRRAMLLTASSADQITTVFLAVPLVVGWVALFALWWFVFRGRKDGEDAGG